MDHSYFLRPARKEDCTNIAALYRISSDGVADYVWTQLALPGQELLDVGRQRYERESTPFSYQNCTLVELREMVIGMLVAFPMHVTSPAENPDPVLAPYSKLEEDNSFYICGMALFPDYRGRGIGRRLLTHAEQLAKKHRYQKLSLIVFEQNIPARRLYESSGFLERRREPVHPHPLIHFTGDVLLMVKSL